MVKQIKGKFLSRLRKPYPGLMLIAFLAYSAFICFMEIKHHVFWRDEIRAFSIAKQADSFSDLTDLLQNEGHPVGWYVLLKSFYLVFHANWVLPFVSILVAIIAAAVWLQFAPFSLPIRALFLVGVFPLYEFSILARNYGISMLLMFLFCSQFDKRLTRPAWAYLPLFFLSFTNAHSALITGIVTGVLVLELLFRKIRRVAPYVWAGAVLVATAWVVWMLHSRTTSSIVFDAGSLNAGSFVHALSQFIQDPGHALVPKLDYLSPEYQWLFRTSVIVAFGLVLIRQPVLFVLYLIVTCALSCFSDLVYLLQFRHQGIFYVFWVSCVWVERSLTGAQTSQQTSKKTKGSLAVWSRYAAPALVLALMVWQASMGESRIEGQFEMENSSANLVGDLIRSHPEWKNAVLIGEPDFVMDTIPYYLDNQIYFPRGGRFGNWVLFTREWRSQMTLEELTHAAEVIHASTPKPVLFLIGTQIHWTPGQTGRSFFGYRQSLAWTAAGLDHFLQNTRKVGEFQTKTAGDESYSVYEWAGANPPGLNNPAPPQNPVTH